MVIKIKFKDIVKKLGKTTLYITFPVDHNEKYGLKKGDAVEIDYTILNKKEVET